MTMEAEDIFFSQKKMDKKKKNVDIKRKITKLIYYIQD